MKIQADRTRLGTTVGMIAVAILVAGTGGAAILASSTSSAASTVAGPGGKVSGALRYALRASRRAAGYSIGSIGQDSEQRVLSTLSRHFLVDASTATPIATFKAVLGTGSENEVNALASAGARIRGHVGRVVSFDAPLSEAESFAKVWSVRYLDIAKRMKPELDVSGPEIGADAVRDPGGIGATGSGVLVASIDTGHDVKHLDFRKPDKTTRFKSVLNMDPSCGGPRYPNGLHPTSCYFDDTRINKFLKGKVGLDYSDPASSLGHGSHTLGIAAGNGQATGKGFPASRYVGVAPGADLIGVRLFDKSGSQVGDITEALEFLMEEQARLGNPPLVVNLSLGHQFGAHDGTDPDEITIDDMIADGQATGAVRVVTKSAGNSGLDDVFIEGTAPVGGLGQIHHFTIPSTFDFGSGQQANCGTSRGAGNDILLVDLWYEGSDTLTVRLTSPHGAPYFENSTGNDPNLAAQDTSSGTIFVDCPSDVHPGGRECVVGVDDSGGVAPEPGTWTLSVFGNTIPSGGEYDAWIALAARGVCTWGWDNPSSGNSITIPGTSNDVLTVGAYVTKKSWTNVGGVPVSYTDPTILVNEIGAFSSMGPTRDGRLKPEIAAPGMGIASVRARSVSTARGTEGRLRVVEDGKHMVLEGTSMSSPHVAGAAALLLSIDPLLTTSEVRQLLMDNAVADSFTGGVPNQTWGMGKLNVLAAANAVQTSKRPGDGPE